MRASIVIFLAAVAFVTAQKSPPVCPTVEKSFGICTFDPNVNCLQDSECQGGQLCCADGCNKICKDPASTDEVDNQNDQKPAPVIEIKKLECPAPSGSFGICVFDEENNCLNDSQCQNGQMCCSEGCNKICKDPVTADEPIKPQTKPAFETSDDQNEPKPTPGVEIKQCPKPSGSFGICVYDEKINCASDSQCENGQMCCTEGCNSICKDPVTFQPIKPQPKPAFQTGN